MKKIALLLALAPLSAFALTTYDTARVESVEPLMETTRIAGQCRTITTTETVQGQQQAGGSGIGGGIIGGIAGGLLGSQIGGGHGKTAATAIGAIGGALVGSNMDRNSAAAPQQTTSTRQVCDPDQVSNRVTGYRVDYSYQGQRGTVNLPYQPGSTLEMRVTAEPVIR